ncbi:HNH endonuclease [Carnobacterium maltaromaticum]|uniref:HNH endonuclease n=1 Tax=Carnobacterium maltaromaticum TaxID=2751 RepID=UPI00295F1E5C|nr:HNH endonuclease [Carnobacterium maltaromaticum]MDW5523743.1 HNH endonuclease [Carnobacterium maltaromaticum]
MDTIHEGLLKKFQALKNQTFHGQQYIKGLDQNRLAPDNFVPVNHLLHDLIRGFYKPAKKPYLLSYRATESINNYGEQIIWKDEKKIDFKLIEMKPPNGEKDNRKTSDINAARYNLKFQIPIGILYKEKESFNRILGLGMIVAEQENGTFIVTPYDLNDKIVAEDSFNYLISTPKINTDVKRQIIARNGQFLFKQRLLNSQNKCAVCEINDINFLVASHIKPWKHSNHQERLDPNNGLLLCPNHDKLFDSGTISFKDSGEILISETIDSFNLHAFKITKNTSITLNDSAKKNMNWHRKYIFK